MFRKKGAERLFIVTLLAFFVIACQGVVAFEFNGTVLDTNGNALNGTIINITIRNQQFSIVGYNHTRANETGYFTLPVADNPGWLYQPVITYRNATTNAAMYIGQSLPAFPSAMLQQLVGTSFFLREAGTLNITAVNATGQRVPFTYQVKDTSLGFPVAEDMQTSRIDTTVFVPRDRNYSIMIYPAASMPISVDWNNFTAPISHAVNAISSYNATTWTLNRQFNTTLTLVRVSGYMNRSGLVGWNNFTVVPFVMEPGNMVHATYGDMPFNLSAMLSNQTDTYNAATGFYNISLPATVETSQMLLFATARNGTFYGAFRNLSLRYSDYLSGNELVGLNFTHTAGLLGASFSNLSLETTASGGSINISTARQTFTLVNASNSTLSSISAHVEVTLDYAAKSAVEFTWMEDIAQSANPAAFTIPLLNDTAVKEINVFSSGGDANNYAPKRLAPTVAQVQANSNITMKSFSPGEIDGSIAAANIFIELYISNATCDVPNPPAGCGLGGSQNMDPTSSNMFNPMKAILGGGKISFRMGTGSIIVHYVNVDMLASGPPDALFDDSATQTQRSGTFGAALRFGSQGPKIFDYVLVSVPYSVSSGTGLDETRAVNLSIPVFYDDEWNLIWNVSTNGSSGSAFSGNYSHYSAHAGSWETLMNGTVCVTNSSSVWFNVTSPCYLDTSNNRAWVRLPHFSGTGPSLSGTLSTTATAASSTSSGGGADAGRGDAGAGYVDVNYRFSEVLPGEEQEITVQKEQLGVESVVFTAGGLARDVIVSLREHQQLPPSTATPTFTPYKYFEVKTTNLPSQSLTKSAIVFTVTAAWLADKGNPADVALYKFDGAWKKLPTRYLGASGNVHRFEAATGGFSYFAIGLASGSVPQSSTSEETATVAESSAREEAPAVGVKGIGKWVWGIAVLGVAIVVFLVVVVWKGRARGEGRSAAYKPVVETVQSVVKENVQGKKRRKRK